MPSAAQQLLRPARLMPLPLPHRRRAPPAAPVSAGSTATAEGEEEIVGWTWTGSDEFTPLGDRRDEPPLPLPRLRHSKRLVLVRHGQSTWNARNRNQVLLLLLPLLLLLLLLLWEIPAGGD